MKETVFIDIVKIKLNPAHIAWSIESEEQGETVIKVGFAGNASVVIIKGDGIPLFRAAMEKLTYQETP